MFQPIEIYLKNGDVGFCTLSYSDSEDLRKQILNLFLELKNDRYRE